MHEEHALSFACGDERLVGILSLPTDAQAATRGVVIVVGGPQYRAGSHRQFTLLARALADAGTPTLRFDYRGMGDSEGALRDFEAVDADLRAAIDALFDRQPQLRDVALFGLCDGATAAALYAPGDARVTGLALANPWVRTEAGAARATFSHYYTGRLGDAGLWRKIARGEFRVGAALHSLLANLRALFASSGAAALPERLYARLRGFDGAVLVMLSGADLTAREFANLTTTSRGWRRLLRGARVTRRDLAGADHTFSRREWHDTMTGWVRDWMRAW